MSSSEFVRDPHSVLDFGWDYAAKGWLADGETITAAVVTLSAGITKHQAETHDDTTVTVWISGGAAGNTYSAQCRVTTSEGRIDDRTIYLITKER